MFNVRYKTGEEEESYPSVTPPSGGKRAAHKTRLCASDITQSFQKRSATDAVRSCHATSWKTTKDRETSRLTILFKNSIGEGPLGPAMQEKGIEETPTMDGQKI